MVGLRVREAIAGLPCRAYNGGMEFLGLVQRGVVVPQGDAHLPEGGMVRILYEPEPVEGATKAGHRVELPLVESGEPGTLHLTNEMIAEIFDEEDAFPR